MKCLKCGNETEAERLFCDICLKNMEQYPVNPSAPVVIPKRKEAVPVRKPPRKKVLPLDEQIEILKKRIRILAVVLAVMILLCSLLVYPAVRYLMEDHFLPGQNYTSIVSKSSAVTETD